MKRVFQILLAIILSFFFTQVEIISDVFFFSGVVEPGWGYFFYTFLILFSGYLYIFLLIFLSYELRSDIRGFNETKLLKDLGLSLFTIHLVFFFLIRTVIWLFFPSIFPIYELASMYVSLGIMPVIFIPLFFFGVSNERRYGNYITSFAILYLIYFIITLLYYFFISPELMAGGKVTLIIGTTLTTLQILLIYLAAGYLFFFGIRAKLPQFILISFSWLYYSVYRQLSDLMSSIGVYRGEYVYMLLIIVICLLGIMISIRYFELGKRLKRGLRIFISHSIEDFNPYRIKDIANFLKSQKKIGNVYFCEEYLTGNIDKWMKKTVQKSQVLVFLSTLNSINSKDSIFELDLAREKKLHIIPILGVELQWEDLKELNLHREFGSNFSPMDFEKFCNDLYQQIVKFIKVKSTELIEEKK
ncbi:MAG: hypothetical protein ACFFCI_12300 [Promethearchaeota archaeon]